MFCLSFRPQVLQPRVQRAMAVLRDTPLWQLLRDLYDATELPASVGPYYNAIGAHGINRLLLGGVVGMVKLGAAVEVRYSDPTNPDEGDCMTAQQRQSYAACKQAPAREATPLDSDLARAARRNKLLYLEVWRLPGEGRPCDNRRTFELPQGLEVGALHFPPRLPSQAPRKRQFVIIDLPE